MLSVQPRALLVCFILILSVDQVSRSSMLNEASIRREGARRPVVHEAESASFAAAALTGVGEEGVSGQSAVDFVPYNSEAIHRIYRVTAYCDRGTTAAGVPSGVGQCAAPADIPFGSRIYIPELDRTFIVTDRTAKRFRHNTVDLYLPDRTDCKRFGRRYLECEITTPACRIAYASKELKQILAETGENGYATEAGRSLSGSFTGRTADVLTVTGGRDSGMDTPSGEFVAFDGGGRHQLGNQDGAMARGRRPSIRFGHQSSSVRIAIIREAD